MEVSIKRLFRAIRGRKHEAVSWPTAHAEARIIYEEPVDVQFVPGDVFTLKARVKPSGGHVTGRIGIYDGVGTTWSEPITTSGWTTMVVTHVMTTKASEMTTKFEMEGLGIKSFRIDELTVSLTDIDHGAIPRQFIRRLFRKGK